MKPSPQRLMVRIAAILAIAVVLSLAIPWSAFAESSAPVTIKNLKISIWPEYDDPRVLVMYEGDFADPSLFPQPVKFYGLPASEIKQVCALTKPENEHKCQTFKALEEDGFLAINFTLPITTYFLEYYWPGVQGDTSKSFNYQFKSPYNIENLEINVQQPLRSSGWTITPTPTNISSDAQGFKFSDYIIKNVEAGRPIKIDASYIKTDTNPSVPPAATGTTGGVDKTPLIISVVLSLAAVGAIGWFLMSSRRKSRRPAYGHAYKAGRAARAEQPQQIAKAPAIANVRASRGAAPQVARVPVAAKGAPPRNLPRAFCSHCGFKLDDGGAFCPGCGAEVNPNV